MKDELEKLLEGYKSFEEDNEDVLKDYNIGALYMCDWVGSNVDDAFELGEEYGKYNEALEIVYSLEKILKKFD